MLDIVEAIMNQLFSKVSVLPHSIRMFCKFLYEQAMNKWGSELSNEAGYGLVSHFILSRWLLPVCFKDLHLYGLTKDFYLGENCHDNLRLLNIIMEKTMNF